ncbi:MAG: AAA family ATPase [Patescibacteria group bacterium]
MNAEQKQKISVYLRNQLSQAENRLSALTMDRERKPLLKRSAALILEKYVRNFSQYGKEPRWVAIPGLRGAGKTTLLAQIYTGLSCAYNHKLYISLDEAKKVLGVSLNDILVAYEEVLGMPFENLKSPIYLFIDEVQYEENWGLVLKSIYDRSKNIFIFCTGSSALSLQFNPDISRRLVLEKLYPMSFTEYMLLKDRKYQISGLGRAIKNALFNSGSAKRLYETLKSVENGVSRYWVDVNRFEIDNYLKYGTLPFALQYSEESLIYSQVEQTLSNIISRDIPQMSKFDSATLSKMNQILYSVASSSTTSLTSLAKTFEMSISTLLNIFEVFEKSEVLLRIYPHGSHFGQVKKPSKYLFVSSAYRNMFFNLIGSIYSYDNYKGFLLEDIVGLYLYRILGLRFGVSLTYDSSEGGADFIVTLEGKKIVIETGYGEKNFNQVESTRNRIKGTYGISVSSSELSIDENKQCVSLPINYFLLM